MYKESKEPFEVVKFRAPAKEYRAAPFWAWTGKPEKNVMEEQVSEFREMGFGGFFIHSRVGLNVEYLGKELTITVTSDLQYGGDQEDQHNPLFTVINGHRITMLKQKNTAGFTPEAEQPVFEFSASVKLPEKGHVRSVRLEFTVSDENGTELNKLKDTISIGDHSSGRDIGAFYIPVEIGTINTVIAITAAVIWMIVLIRFFTSKKKRIGD